MQVALRALKRSSHPVKRIALPSISFIVARSVPGHVIGCENKLPWHLRDDLKLFKKYTQNHVVIMGRRTLESIGRPLPHRTNIILSRSPLPESENVYRVSSKEDALFLADYLSMLQGQNEYFIIGGASIYAMFASLFGKIYLTEVFAPHVEGDAHFNYNFDLREWSKKQEDYYASSEVNEFAFQFSILEKKRAYRRDVLISEFMKEKDKFLEFYSSNTGKLVRHRIASINEDMESYFNNKGNAL